MHFFSQVAYSERQSDAIRWDLSFRNQKNTPGLPPRPKANRVRFFPHLYAEGDEISKWDYSLSCFETELFQPALNGVMPWRQLEVEVTPESVRAWWGNDRQAVGELTKQWVTLRTEEMRKQMRLLRPEDRSPDNLDANQFPRGSLGLLLNKGSASFRRVVVEPLVR
jgi:hypothetical protein